MPETNKAEVTATMDKETKRMYRFKEDGDQGILGTFYVKQDVFDSAPKKIKVVVEKVE